MSLWLVWSTAFEAIKVGLRHANPATFTLLRVVAALLTLMVVCTFRGRWHRLRSRRLDAYAVPLGATNVAGFLVFQNLGLADRHLLENRRSLSEPARPLPPSARRPSRQPPALP